MEDRRSLLWLKAAFLVGAITDALALVPMLCPKFTEVLWGLDGLNGSYIFARVMVRP